MHAIRYYHIVKLPFFDVEAIRLEDTGEILSKEAFEQLKVEDKDVDYLLR